MFLLINQIASLKWMPWLTVTFNKSNAVLLSKPPPTYLVSAPLVILHHWYEPVKWMQWREKLQGVKQMFQILGWKRFPLSSGQVHLFLGSHPKLPKVRLKLFSKLVVINLQTKGKVFLKCPFLSRKCPHQHLWLNCSSYAAVLTKSCSSWDKLISFQQTAHSIHDHMFLNMTSIS